MMTKLTLLEWIALYAGALGTAAYGSDSIQGVGAAAWQALPMWCCCVAALYYNKLYDFRSVRSSREFLRRLPRAAAVALVLLAIVYTILPEARVGASSFVSSLLVIGAILMPVRALSYSVMRSPTALQNVLILGTNPLARQIIEEIEARPDLRYAVVGVVGARNLHASQLLRRPLLGSPEHLARIIERIHVDRIIVAMAERRGRLPVSQLMQLRVRGIVVEDGADVYERLTGKLAIESLTASSLLFSNQIRISRLERAIARVTSLLAAAAGLIILSPLLGLVALGIRLESAGPVFFVQERVGLRGKRFKLIKFRTMRPSQVKTSEWARDNSDRITPLGRWLRRFRLDELPQFLNILRGDMNLVGPRPHPVSNWEIFVTVMRNASERGDEIPYYSLRSMVRPGLTGWAQTRYRYANDLEEEIEKMRYDLYYIRHMSLLMDLRILFDTFKIVLLGRESGAVLTPPAVVLPAPTGQPGEDRGRAA